MPSNAQEIRQSYLKFFENHGHVVRPGAPLAPDDPTLLFSVAGMVQFKPLFAMAPEQLPFTRATTVQKCLRANDLESVGRTLRHHTFFEMLGNFSFGDYFKAEAIEWAWEYCTRILDLDRKRIWISIFEDDDEAQRLWQKIAGLPQERIVRLGTDDNFWGPAGDTGACGPSSELYFDTGEKHGCGRSQCTVGCDCDRYIEFWNLVFPQFDQQPDGRRLDLAHPGIDTGMGLERTAFILEGVEDNYHSDLFRPIIAKIEALSGLEYKQNESSRLAMNAVADHVRALTFALAESIYPSNEGRGYVLRRILRRASGKLRSLGIQEPFLYRLVDVVVDVMAGAYAELSEVGSRVAALIEAEEQRFVTTLETGMSRFEEALAKASKKKNVIAGPDLFTLYDTFGFPPELTSEMAGDRGIGVDWDGFRQAMEAQRQRARSHAAFRASKIGDHPEIELEKPRASEFVGYERMQQNARLQVLRWRRGERREEDAHRDRALCGEAFDLILDRTPFYATAGGQVADQGVWSSDDLIWRVADVRKEGDQIVHSAVLIQHPGSWKTWENLVEALQERGEIHLLGTVEEDVRLDTMRNHTATHILHAALKKVLGQHVQQAGSLVAPDRLRFDFNHFAALTAAELRQLENEINALVLRNIEVTKEIKDYEEAIGEGAVAMFGEKYDERVRVVTVGDYSKELCGGTHVERTGDIGPFVFTSEGSVASGVRRVEALTGRGAQKHLQSLRDEKAELTKLLGSSGGQSLRDKVTELQNESRRLKRTLGEAQAQLAGGLASRLMREATDVNGSRVIAAKVAVPNVDALRELADSLRREMSSGAAVLSTEMGEKIVFLAMVTDDLVEKGIKAGDLVGRVAKMTGGGGGGKPHLAQAGGRDKSKWQEALEQVVPHVRSLL